MNSLKLYETTKLHYGEYLYKLVLTNELSNIFRSELQRHTSLGFAKEQLNNLKEKYILGEPLERQIYRSIRIIPTEHYLDAVDIYSTLKFSKDFKIRVDLKTRMSIYTNEKSTLKKIINKMRVSNTEFWEPDVTSVNMLLGEENIIITNNIPVFPFKITLGTQKIDTNFAYWLKSNTDKSRIGNIALTAIEQGLDVNGLYFFIRDEKVLSLITMIIGHNIRRIDRLIYKQNIDK